MQYSLSFLKKKKVNGQISSTNNSLKSLIHLSALDARSPPYSSSTDLFIEITLISEKNDPNKH